MHRHADNLSKFFVVHVFNMDPISVCTGIDANSKILNYATTCVCCKTLGECFNSLFQLSKSARLLFVHFCFSSTPKEVKRRKIRTMQRPFELCLQAPNSVSKQCAQMSHSRVCCMESAPSCWNHKNLFWFGVYSLLRSSLI